MLHLVFKGVPNSSMAGEDVIMDLEQAFKNVTLAGTEDECRMLRVIEQAEYRDDKTFVDRFGTAWDYEYLSTGCKGALVVLKNPDRIVDITECGYNARDAIINFCEDGTILLRESSVTVVEMAESICVSLNGHEFKSVSELNRYVQDVYPLW